MDPFGNTVISVVKKMLIQPILFFAHQGKKMVTLTPNVIDHR